MSSYVEKRILTKSEYMTPEEHIKKLERRITSLECVLEEMSRMLGSFGLTVKRSIGTSIALKYGHGSLKACPVCGGVAYVQESIDEPGVWIAMCDQCGRRTKGSRKVKDEILGWNRDQVTEASRIVGERLTAREMSDEGAKRLMEAIVENAADEYTLGVRVSGSPSVESAWFFEGSGRAAEILRARVEKEEKEAEK